MKKTGFTLAELLITLGIIGVIVAILVPAVNNAMPDENKTMYLKTYDTLSDTIKNLASNSQIYPICEQENNINCSENPLLNTGAPSMSPLRNDVRYRGDVKLCNLLALSFGAANSSCSAGDYTYSNDTFKNNLSFITSNGMQWKVVQNRTIADGNATFQADIYVDINGNKGNNRIYSTTDTKPDIFKFMVAANGTVVPADPMGKAYLSSRKSLLKKNIVVANNDIPTELNDNLRRFEYQPCFVDVTTPNFDTDDPPVNPPPSVFNLDIASTCGGQSSHLEVYGVPGYSDGSMQVTALPFGTLYKNNAIIMLHRKDNNDSYTSTVRSRLTELVTCTTNALLNNGNANASRLETAKNNAINYLMSTYSRRSAADGDNHNTERTALGTKIAIRMQNKIRDKYGNLYNGVVKYTDFDGKDYQVNMVSFKEVVDTIIKYY